MGRALVNTSLAGPIYGTEVNDILMAQIDYAMGQGLLSISSVQRHCAGKPPTIMRVRRRQQFSSHWADDVIRASDQPLPALESIYKRPSDTQPNAKAKRRSAPRR